MKTKTFFCLVWIVFFLLSQGVFSAHQLSHFEETSHQEECFICDLDPSVFCDSHKKLISFIAFEKNTHGQESLFSTFPPASPFKIHPLIPT